MPKITVKDGVGTRGFNMYGDGVPGRYIELHPDHPVEVSDAELKFLEKFAEGQFVVLNENAAPQHTEGENNNGKDHRKKR